MMTEFIVYVLNAQGDMVGNARKAVPQDFVAIVLDLMDIYPTADGYKYTFFEQTTRQMELAEVVHMYVEENSR